MAPVSIGRCRLVSKTQGSICIGRWSILFHFRRLVESPLHSPLLLVSEGSAVEIIAMGLIVLGGRCPRNGVIAPGVIVLQG